MVRRKDRGLGSAVQWSVLQLLLWAVAAYGGQNTSTAPCGLTLPLTNCTLKASGNIPLNVCDDVQTYKTCRIVIRAKVVTLMTVSLKRDVAVKLEVAYFVPVGNFQELSLELVKQGNMQISFTHTDDVDVEKIVAVEGMKSMDYLLKPEDQVLLIGISRQYYKLGLFFLRERHAANNYWLLRSRHGNCLENLSLSSWDVFQYHRQDLEFGITCIGRSNDTEFDLSEDDWEVYRMVLLNTCNDTFCQLCTGVNHTATSLMKKFGLLDETVDAFNPCFLSPVLHSAKCEISPDTTSRCLQLSELNMSRLNISASLSSPLEPVLSLKKLILSNNNLSGNVSAFSRFQNLTDLDLRGNFFQVLRFEESMPNLTHLNLARNELTSVTLDKLTGLRELSLMKNNLKDNFSSVFQERNLRKLDIRFNNFYGKVPEDMLNMTWFKPGNCELQGDEGIREKNPPFNEKPQEGDKHSCGSGSKKVKALVVAAGVIGALLLGCAAFALFYFLLNKKRRGKDSSSLPRSNSSHEGTGFLRRQKLHDVGFPREFGIREIEAATETAATTPLGKGAFGDVFEATLDGSRVVIKFRAKGTTSLLQEFQRDVKKLGSYNHKNLVRVLGFCDEKEYQALVIEWMPNGSLEYHLYGSSIESALNWRARLKVLAGAASGIEFLHGGDYRQICLAGSPLIHCDIKSSNILLGDQFEAKVADFGYFKPKLFGDKFHSDLRYFEGYLDPEYLSNDQKNELDKKSDVFSFGVVILETVTGRPPIDTFGGQEPLTIAQWVRNRKNDGNLKDIIDPRLPEGSYLFDVVRNVVEVALECLNASSSARPAMKSVRRSLEDAYKMESRSGNSTSMELPSVDTQPSGHLSR